MISAGLTSGLIRTTMSMIRHVQVNRVRRLLDTTLRQRSTNNKQGGPVKIITNRIKVKISRFQLRPRTRFRALNIRMINRHLRKLQTVKPSILHGLPVTRTKNIITTKTRPTIIRRRSFRTKINNLINRHLRHVRIIIRMRNFPYIRSRQATIQRRTQIRKTRMKIRTNNSLIRAVTVKTRRPQNIMKILTFTETDRHRFTTRRRFTTTSRTNYMKRAFNKRRKITTPTRIRQVNITVLRTRAKRTNNRRRKYIRIETTNRLQLFRATSNRQLTLQATFA